MSCGKIHELREHTVTFWWEVGFALGFVGPVYDQVSIATETVGDLIYKNEERRQTDFNVYFHTIRGLKSGLWLLYL